MEGKVRNSSLLGLKYGIKRALLAVLHGSGHKLYINPHMYRHIFLGVFGLIKLRIGLWDTWRPNPIHRYLSWHK